MNVPSSCTNYTVSVTVVDTGPMGYESVPSNVSSSSGFFAEGMTNNNFCYFIESVVATFYVHVLFNYPT